MYIQTHIPKHRPCNIVKNVSLLYLKLLPNPGKYFMSKKEIALKGVRVNNLKNIDLNLPLNKFIVITGVSGSGKSSLAFDTLYAEGQRRYVESLSAYARQFLGRMAKPECDYIKGLPPAIAIEQKVNTRNPRSTVGTATEIYDYLRMLFARIGKTISPISGNEVKKNSIENITETILSYPERTRLAILARITLPEGRSLSQQLDIYLKEGYSRVMRGDEFIDITDIVESVKDSDVKKIFLLIDRLSVNQEKDTHARLTDSIETAYFEGHDECIIKIWTADGIKEQIFSSSFTADGMTFREPDDLMFNFNNPYGACPTCEGFGKVLGISEDLVIPDKTLSVYADAVQCFRGEKMSEMKQLLIRNADKIGFPIHKPYMELTKEERDILWHGKEEWPGIDEFFRWVDTQQYKIQYRVMKARYRGKAECPDCRGTRLRPDVKYVKIANKDITEMTTMTISELRTFFDNLTLSETEKIIATRLLTEIKSRLQFLDNVGLGYLTLSRQSSTLSGGESQRINLATSLGSSLVGSLYILDEPSIGLHSRDSERLIKVLRDLQEIGNTVVVVEHDEDIMRSADYIIDIGKDAGALGGEIVYAGALDDIFAGNISEGVSYTADYLQGRLSVPQPTLRRPWKKYIEVQGACEHNLKNIDVHIPLGIITVVTGVSGSGKSTLVREVLYKAIKRRMGEGTDLPGAHKALSGNLDAISTVEFVDQNPIGTSTRSNPATYLKAFDEIRRLFSEQQSAVQMGFSPAFFSFNNEGGRCEECKGEGVVNIPMQFMADITIPCEACHGKRFKQDVLDIKYRGKNIHDFLEMTISDAVSFLSEKPDLTEKRIIKRLQPLLDVGLGYVKLGQSSSTLSGGENQRVKLAYFLSKENNDPILFIFDEPTTGLHFNDISTLMRSFNHLIARGHTVLIIEHNLDVVRCADWVIDIGPEGGENGGSIVVAGTPETVANTKDSYTGKFLAEKLQK